MRDFKNRGSHLLPVLHVSNEAHAAVSMATAVVKANSGDDVNGYALGMKHVF